MTGTYDPATFKPLSFCDRTEAFRTGSDSPRAYLERCLDTIATREPEVKAWVVLNVEGARAAADAASARWKAGTPLSSIDGMPVGIKDLLQTKDMPTQLGCKAFEGAFPKADNPMVWALREAGAVILGKTVTTELGGAHPGPTLNPFNSDHTPGGSSSGTAAAIGACMVPGGIGSQVAGSIIRPAGYCANYALKPSQGGFNRGERNATSMSTHGPHAGTLQDMWQMAIEIAIRAGGDAGAQAVSGPMDLPPALRPMVLAVIEGPGWDGMPDAALTAFEAVLDQLRAAGVTILRRGDHGLLERFECALTNIRDINLSMTAWENQSAMRNILDQHPDGLSDRARATLARAQEIGVAGYRDLMQERAMVRGEYAALMRHVDGAIAPASVGPAPKWYPGMELPMDKMATGDPIFNMPSSAVGVPALTMPLTAVGGLPMGIQLMGKGGDEARLTGMARWVCDTVTPVSV